jgi:hypothetical protein
VNSRKAERERLHRIATYEARELSCLICGRGPCEPCHYPKHRGLGGGHAGWESHEWWPLCRRHHDLVDGRLGVSPHVEACRHWAVRQLEDAIERREL